MNTWDNIKAAQIAHDLVHRESSSENIADFNLSCIYYVGDNKSRTRNYRNFLIYLTNHYQLTDAMDETNLAFEKLSRRLEVLIQESEEETNRETARSARKNAKEIFETVRLGRIPKMSFNDTVSILIGVAYGTRVFEDVRNIEVAHQLAYQKVVREGNYQKRNNYPITKLYRKYPIPVSIKQRKREEYWGHYTINFTHWNSRISIVYITSLYSANNPTRISNK